MDQSDVCQPTLCNCLALIRFPSLAVKECLSMMGHGCCRSGVVVREHGAKKGCALLFVRGGTSTIRRLLDKQTLPSDYSNVRL